MKFDCACGRQLVDSGDGHPHKARVVADRDWERFLDDVEQGAPDAPWTRHVRALYQCPDCGRLWLDQGGRRLLAFVPEAREGPPRTDLFARD